MFLCKKKDNIMFLFVIKEKNTSHYYFLVSWKKPSKKKHDGFSLPQKTTVIMSIVQQIEKKGLFLLSRLVLSFFLLLFRHNDS